MDKNKKEDFYTEEETSEIFNLLLEMLDRVNAKLMMGEEKECKEKIKRFNIDFKATFFSLENRLIRFDHDRAFTTDKSSIFKLAGHISFMRKKNKVITRENKDIEYLKNIQKIFDAKDFYFDEMDTFYN